MSGGTLPLSKPEVWLASTSARRRSVLEMLGVAARIVEPGAVERAYAAPQDPAEYAVEQALAKLRSVTRDQRQGAVLVAADTIVLLEGRVLGKPESAEEARRMLRALSGRSHEVITAVAVAWRGRERVAFERSRVAFRDLSEREIARYVEGGEPLDKAGAYGIQGRGAALVRRIEGCFFNVVGLPVSLLLDLLADLELGYDFLEGIVGPGRVIEAYLQERTRRGK